MKLCSCTSTKYRLLHKCRAQRGSFSRSQRNMISSVIVWNICIYISKSLIFCLPWASVHKSNSNPPVQWWRPDPHRSTRTVLYGWSLQTTTSVAEAVASWACFTLNFVTDAHSNETLPAGFMDLSVLRVVRETGQAAERAYSVFEVRISIKKWSYPSFIASVILMPLLFISNFEKFKEKQNQFAKNL